MSEDIFNTNSYLRNRLSGIKSEKVAKIEAKFATKTVSEMIASGMGVLRPEAEVRKLYAERPKKSGVPATFIPITRVFNVEALVADRDDETKKAERAAAKKTAIDGVNNAYNELVEALKVDALDLAQPNVKAMFLAFRDMAV